MLCVKRHCVHTSTDHNEYFCLKYFLEGQDIYLVPLNLALFIIQSFLVFSGNWLKRGSLILYQAENWLTLMPFKYFHLLSPGSKDCHHYWITWKFKTWDFMDYPGLVLILGWSFISHGIALSLNVDSIPSLSGHGHWFLTPDLQRHQMYNLVCKLFFSWSTNIIRTKAVLSVGLTSLGSCLLLNFDLIKPNFLEKSFLFCKDLKKIFHLAFLKFRIGPNL